MDTLLNILFQLINFPKLLNSWKGFTAEGQLVETFASLSDYLQFRIVNVGQSPIVLDQLVFEINHNNRKYLNITNSIGKQIQDPFKQVDIGKPKLEEGEIFQFSLNFKDFESNDFNLSKLSKVYISDSKGRKRKIGKLANAICKKFGMP